MKFIYPLSIIFFLFSTLITPSVAQAATCPGPLDTKVNQDPVTGICYSESDPLYNPGLNTTGGTRTCAVQCPGTTGTLPLGNDCVVQINGQCYAGNGPSGFNTPGCVASSTTPLPQCPSPMALNLRVVDPRGNAVSGITFTVTYADAPPGTQPGQSVNATSDPLGTASIQAQLYSGDHFIIVPSSPYYTFMPTQMGNNNNVGQLEMNTTFPGNCGTSLENGTSLQPCTFVATRNNVPMPPGGSTGPFTATDQTVNDTTNSLTQTMMVLGAIGVIGYVVITIGGSGRLDNKPYNNG